jgi:integrase
VEVNRVPVLERFLQDVADRKGRGSAKPARTVLGSVLGLAVREEALDGNRMRDAQPPRQGAARASGHEVQRAFTTAELSDVLSKADKDQSARANDITDLIYVLAGTGARISEALALQWDDVDLDACEVRIREPRRRGLPVLRRCLRACGPPALPSSGARGVGAGVPDSRVKREGGARRPISRGTVAT